MACRGNVRVLSPVHTPRTRLVGWIAVLSCWMFRLAVRLAPKLVPWLLGLHFIDLAAGPEQRRLRERLLPFPLRRHPVRLSLARSFACSLFPPLF